MQEAMVVEIPKSLENMQLPSPELLTYYKDLENRILWLDDEVNSYTMEFVKLILRYRKTAGKPTV